MIDLSIIVVSYRVREYMLKCLDSIYRHPPGVSFEVIVVDNISADGTPEAVKELFPQVKLIANTENVGFARANNQGIRASNGRYLLFLNPDTEVGKGTLSGLLDFAVSQPRASAFTCRLLNSDGTLQHSCYRFPNLRMAFFGFFPLVPTDSTANGRYAEECYERVFEPEHVLGACLMVKRDAMDKVGEWDGKFFMYFEETDLCYRLKQADRAILYTPEFSIVHYGDCSASQVREEMSVVFYRSQARFYRKYYSWARFFVLKIIVSFGLLFWTVRSCVSFLRRRIDGTLLRTRLSGYLKILMA